MTGMAMSAARIVEDGVIKVGAELGRAVLMLVPFADSGIGECNLVNAGSTKGSLGKLHIVDNEMEVERKMRVDHRGKAACFGCGCAKENSALPRLFHLSTPTPNTSPPFSFIRRDILRPTPFN